MSELALKLKIHGVVQGVGYRDWMVKAASAVSVDGWVRNRNDGTVEALIVGDPRRVHELIQRCMDGPPFAKVERIDEEAAQGITERGTFTRKPTV